MSPLNHVICKNASTTTYSFQLPHFFEIKNEERDKTIKDHSLCKEQEHPGSQACHQAKPVNS